MALARHHHQNRRAGVDAVEHLHFKAQLGQIALHQRGQFYRRPTDEPATYRAPTGSTAHKDLRHLLQESAGTCASTPRPSICSIARASSGSLAGAGVIAAERRLAGKGYGGGWSAAIRRSASSNNAPRLATDELGDGHAQ